MTRWLTGHLKQSGIAGKLAMQGSERRSTARELPAKAALLAVSEKRPLCPAAPPRRVLAQLDMESALAEWRMAPATPKTLKRKSSSELREVLPVGDGMATGWSKWHAADGSAAARRPLRA
mmetsp:Transcript_93571/g.238255  ORF Transcript_93571/g.238255 Transcript_93571/m.238255 type:complete len:120 (+) Transcript_93571:714-1073(+)